MGETWGRPEGFVPAAAMDHRAVFTLEIKIRNKLNLKPDFAGGLCDLTEWADRAAVSQVTWEQVVRACSCCILHPVMFPKFGANPR